MNSVIFGRHPVLTAMRSDSHIKKIIVAGHLSGSKINEILKLADRRRIPVERVTKDELTELSGPVNNQGVIALVDPGTYATCEDILAKSVELGEPPLLALLDGIEDPHNLGAIIRSADAAGLHGIVIPKRRAAGLTATVAKTSAGASNYFLTAQVSNLNYSIDELKNQNVWIVGAHQAASQTYTEANLTGALGIVVGGESAGLHRLVKEKCDFLVRVPMFGKINSLNASVAAALLFFEARRQRELAKK